MKNTLLALLILALAGTACKNSRKNAESNIDTLFSDTATAAIEPVDSAALFQAMESYRVAPAEGRQQAAQPARTQTTAGGGGAYFMIVGSFSIPDNATAYAAKIREMGYNATIIPGRDNLQMVSARSYASLQDGILELEQFRREVSSQAWVYVRR